MTHSTLVIDGQFYGNNFIPYTASGEDFTLASNTATFDMSSASGAMQCLNVTVIGDSEYESDETATFTLSVTSIGQAGSSNIFTLTIMNDDAGKYTEG